MEDVDVLGLICHLSTFPSKEVDSRPFQTIPFVIMSAEILRRIIPPTHIVVS